MKRRDLVLLELILMLLLFALCAAVCLQLFGNAARISRESGELSGAVGAARSAAACFQAAEGDPAATADLCGAVCTGDTLEAYYDENWQPAQAGAPYRLVLQAETGTAYITVTRGETVLFTLEAKAVDYGR